MSGWFAMSRAMFDHPLFAGKPLNVAAWAWILAAAAWKDTRQDANGKTVVVRRGQLLTSYRQMSKATGIPIQPLRTLIARLQDENAIGTDTNTGRLLITIRNYEKYQNAGGGTNTGDNTPATHDQHTKEQDNNSAKAGSASAPVDLKQIAFEKGRALLGKSGKSEQQAGQILGRWVKIHGVGAVVEAIHRTERESVAEPVAFIEGIFKHKAKTSDPEMHGAFGRIKEVG